MDEIEKIGPENQTLTFQTFFIDTNKKADAFTLKFYCSASKKAAAATSSPSNTSANSCRVSNASRVRHQPLPVPVHVLVLPLLEMHTFTTIVRRRKSLGMFSS